MSENDSNEEMTTARVREFAPAIRNALVNRGWDLDNELTAAQAFDEYCTWHGLIGWGPALMDAVDACREAAQS